MVENSNIIMSFLSNLTNPQSDQICLLHVLRKKETSYTILSHCNPLLSFMDIRCYNSFHLFGSENIQAKARSHLEEH